MAISSFDYHSPDHRQLKLSIVAKRRQGRRHGLNGAEAEESATVDDWCRHDTAYISPIRSRDEQCMYSPFPMASLRPVHRFAHTVRRARGTGPQRLQHLFSRQDRVSLLD
jgi:hypothetical protein